MAVSSVELIVPDWPAPAQVQAIATTRSGGISSGHYATLNLGAHVGDNPQAVTANRKLLREAGRLPSEPCWLQQVHGVEGAEARADTSGAAADWSWSDRTGVVCAVMTADCLPLLICDSNGTRVAAVHAGWRGMSAGVIEAAIANFVTAGLAADELLVWLGPAISASAYEVDGAVYEAMTAAAPVCADAFEPGRPGHWQFDLYAAARARLAAVGVTRVYGGDFCTASEERFYSHRTRPGCGRQASLIWLQNPQ